MPARPRHVARAADAKLRAVLRDNAATRVHRVNFRHKPDSSGFRLRIDATLRETDVSPLGERFTMRVGLRYTLYTSFDGAARNYDSSGRNASDNNTLRLFTWFAL